MIKLKLFVVKDSEFSKFDFKSDYRLVNRFFRSDNVDFIDDANKADYIFYPNDIGSDFFDNRLLDFFRSLHISELFLRFHWKFLFFSSLDNAWNMPISGTWLRESVCLSTNYKQSICVPYNINPIIYNPLRAPLNLRASFLGCVITHPIRELLLKYICLMDDKSNRILFIPRSGINREYGENEQKLMMAQMEKAILESGIVLSPRGVGMNSIRFFESLSFGRTPLLISDNSALPLENEINYNDIIIRLPENSINKLDFIFSISESELVEKGKLGYNIFETYLSAQNFSYNLCGHLMINKEYIYEKRKKNNPILMESNKFTLFDYFIKYLKVYQDSDEIYNVYSTVKCLQKLATEKDLNTVQSIKKNSLEAIKSKILDANMQYLTYVTDKYTNYMLNR